MAFLIKICGVRDEAALKAALEAGAGAVGFMAYPKSKRHIEAAALAELLKRVPCPGVLKAGVFVDPSLELLESYLAAGVDVLQLHGAETPEFALEAGRLAKVWKAFAPKSEADVEAMLRYPAEKLLIDAFNPVAHGGTGAKADWSLAARAAQLIPGRTILAGGLSPENVEEAIRSVRPSGVDVSSGVESAPGVKSPALIAAFVREAKSAAEKLGLN